MVGRVQLLKQLFPVRLITGPGYSRTELNSPVAAGPRRRVLGCLGLPQPVGEGFPFSQQELSFIHLSGASSLALCFPAGLRNLGIHSPDLLQELSPANCKVVSLRSRDFWAVGILGNLPEVWVPHDGVSASCRHFPSGRRALGGGWGRCEGRRQADRKALAAEKGGQRPAPPCPHLCALSLRPAWRDKRSQTA